MNTKVVLFGNADHGKSTIIGYLYAKSYNIDLKSSERKLKKIAGKNYDPDKLLSALVNPEFKYSETKILSKVHYDILPGQKIEDSSEEIKRTDDTIVLKTVTVDGNRVEEVVVENKFITHRFNTRIHHPHNITINHDRNEIEIVMIDTPGHMDYPSERETGVSIGDIGVFCIQMSEVLNDKFLELLLGYHDLWLRFHKNSKIIYVLTKFNKEKYSKEDYILACEKIQQNCSQIETVYNVDVFGAPFSVEGSEPDIAAIIPTAIDFKTFSDINIINRSNGKIDTSWYNGPTLIEAINNLQRSLEANRNEGYVNNLLFSIDNEFNTTKSKTGKVWRVHVKNGALKVGDRVKITSVNINGKSTSETFDVCASVKAIHTEFATVEGIKAAENTLSADLVTIDLKDCAIDGKKISKKEITTTKESVGFAEKEQLIEVGNIKIKIDEDSPSLETVKEGELVLLLWFGNRISANIKKIADTFDRAIICLSEDKVLKLPTDLRFRNIGAISNIQFCVYTKKGVIYFSGKLI